MIEFKKIEISDRQWAEPFIKAANFRGSEYVFTNNFNYRDIYEIEVGRYEGYYIVRAGKTDSYIFPMGSGDLRPVIEAMIADAKQRGKPFRMNGVLARSAAQLEELFPGRFVLTEVRDNYDYIYESEKLITLSGKKLHSKRNFINRFMIEHEGRWSYENITKETLSECWEMNMKWRGENHGDEKSLQEESCAVRSSFEHFDELGLKGGLLRVDGEIVAYTMGRELCEDTFIVHIEKAFSSVAGAYPMINQQFVTANCSGYQYVNREDDVGDEGLRKAKLSYKPAILLEKYWVSELSGI